MFYAFNVWCHVFLPPIPFNTRHSTPETSVFLSHHSDLILVRLDVVWNGPI